MGKKAPALDEDLTEEELEWRLKYDPERLLNLNQIKYRFGNAKKDAETRARNAEHKEELRLRKEEEKQLKAEKKEREKERVKIEKLQTKEEKEREKERQKEKEARQKRQQAQEAIRAKQAREALQARYEQQQAMKEAESKQPPTANMSLEEYVAKAQSLSGQASVEDLISILHARLIMTSHNLELRPQDYMSAIRMLRDIQSEDTPKVEEDPYAITPMAPEDLMERTTEVLLVYLRLWEERHAIQLRWLEPLFKELFQCIFLDQPLPNPSGVRWLIELLQPYYGHAVEPVPSPGSPNEDDDTEV